FGLSGKVVIFDEVHAYDTYMSAILERLLRWLAEVDCTVIMLSATLPKVRRKALVKAYSGCEDVAKRPYPRITLAGALHYLDEQTNSSPVCVEIPKDKASTVNLCFNSTDLSILTNTISKSLEHGGCVAVICNTVNRSIEVYKHLRDDLKGTEFLLFHARTLQMWRREREAEVLRKFDKGAKQVDGTYSNPDRPKRAVLVATQVIEQSLDLDFDLMFSEIAPVDLLLQRMGRLHRHPRRRPSGLESPQFIVLCDAKAVGPPPESFGKSIEYVYDRYVLLRTWLALRQRREIVLPNEIEALVEEVYGESNVAGDEEWGNVLSRAKKQMELARRESEKAAGNLLVCRPKDPGDLIEEFNTQLADDENPEVHKTVRAATREGDPSIAVVMLPLDKTIKPTPDLSEVRELLDRSAKLSHRGLFQILLEMKSPTEWAKNAHLRHTRLLRLDGHNQTQVGDYMLTVDERLGIVIEKEGGEKNE
ncbi:CRISPR-associated helicase Cas3', partial [candidate division KSB3 bacterium]|nr:CRISPR-associated helicase Cas3' [candidate division KSB3 bacterium]MBD3325002.1 CRISPR-associated helicase Cas3' [candidate division KSB3 bacterium]